MKKYKLLALLMLLSAIIFGQTSIYGPIAYNLKSQLWQNYDGNPLHDGWVNSDSDGLISLGHLVGYRAYRGVYQWDLSNFSLSENEVVIKVKLTYRYKIDEAPVNMGLVIYELGDALDDSPISFGDLFFGMQYNSNTYIQEIAQSWENPNTVITYESSSSDIENWRQAISNAIQNDKLVLGFQSWSENIADNVGRHYFIYSQDVQLTIEYGLPQQTVVVRQKRSNNSEFGMVDHWENSQWEDEPSGHPYSLPVGSTEYFQA